SLGLLSLLAPAAQAQDSLDFFKNWIVTGDYAVGGVGLAGLGSGGFAEGDITIPTCTTGHALDASCVPVNTELIGAFLIWSAKEAARGDGKVNTKIKSLSDPADTFHNMFGLPVGPANTPPCWSS